MSPNLETYLNLLGYVSKPTRITVSIEKLESNGLKSEQARIKILSG